jgi:cohesin complex subunit SCC1
MMPEFTLGSTPLPPRASSLKRPRLGSKIATLKRKVQLDDAMVLHAEYVYVLWPSKELVAMNN